MPPNGRQTQLIQGILDLERQIASDKERLAFLQHKELDPVLARQFYGEQLQDPASSLPKPPPSIKSGRPTQVRSPSQLVAGSRPEVKENNFFDKFKERDNQKQKQQYRESLQEQIKMQQQKKAQRKKSVEPQSAVPSGIDQALTRQEQDRQRKRQKELQYREQLKKNIDPYPKRKTKVVDIEFEPVPVKQQAPVKERQKENKQVQRPTPLQLNPHQKAVLDQLEIAALRRKKQFLRQKNKLLISEAQFQERCSQVEQELQHQKQALARGQHKSPAREITEPGLDSYEQFQYELNRAQENKLLERAMPERVFSEQVPPRPEPRHEPRPQPRKDGDYLQTQTNFQQLATMHSLTEEMAMMRRKLESQMKAFHQGMLQFQRNQLTQKLFNQQLMALAQITALAAERQVSPLPAPPLPPPLQQAPSQPAMYLYPFVPYSMGQPPPPDIIKQQSKQRKDAIMAYEQGKSASKPKEASSMGKSSLQSSKIPLQNGRKEARPCPSIPRGFYDLEYRVSGESIKFSFMEDVKVSNMELPSQSKFIMLNDWSEDSFEQDIADFNKIRQKEQVREQAMARDQAKERQKEKGKQVFSLMGCLEDIKHEFKNLGPQPSVNQQKKEQILDLQDKEFKKLNSFVDSSGKKCEERLTFADGGMRFAPPQQELEESEVKEELEEQLEAALSPAPDQNRETSKRNSGGCQVHQEEDRHQQDFNTVQSGRESEFYTVRTETKGSIVKSEFIDQSPDLLRRECRRANNDLPLKASPAPLPQASGITLVSGHASSHKDALSPLSPAPNLRLLNEYMRPPSRKAPLEQEEKKEQLKQTSSFGKRTGSLKRLSELASKASSLSQQFMAEQLQRFCKLPQPKRTVLQELKESEQSYTEPAHKKMNLKEERLKRKQKKHEEGEARQALDEEFWMIERDFEDLNRRKRVDQKQLLSRLNQLEQQSMVEEDPLAESMHQKDLQRLVAEERGQKHREQYAEDFESYSASLN